MRYKQAQDILDAIMKAQRILINIHYRPDCDAVGSAVALLLGLQKKGKKPVLACPDHVEGKFKFLIKDYPIQQLSFDTNSVKDFDLLLLLDSATWKNISGNPSLIPSPNPAIVIDHHKTNILTGSMSIIDPSACSTGEIIYHLLNDWDVPIDAEIATNLFSAIADDTVYFRYSQDPSRTFHIAADLLKKGANKQAYETNILNNYSLSSLHLLGSLLQWIKVVDNKFAYVVLPYDVLVKYQQTQESITIFSNFYLQNIDDINYGVFFVERSPGRVSVILRGKGNYNVAKIAQEIGGGGHTNAAGCTLDGDLDTVTQNVLEKIKTL